ncbi:twin-arginine translocation pathway signal protein [Bordetella genomosp. 7]|jgi:lipid-binding SYLF domain-containing protein|uniref:Twin-arginine translocation pathway signal protein n=1 Tax=Bordetella genomosp. 7 TaxID=1416805 RepID=A0A261RC16_9BORD|nr:lipid-binding SYLF domain-containing protein [Bordetella genomosp. 7]OZI22549.1 twin-arginine translocation pathway signal protein [Bordetella genomosp. 7]OZI25343.1 twin-arginine translocation pathway signal protein [Bordetella genomosp. 7]
MQNKSIGMLARSALLAATLLGGAATAWMPAATAATAAEISRDATQALKELTQQEPKARTLAEKATAVLVFPKIVKAGMLIGGEGGEGALIKNGAVQGYYNLGAVSFGLQAGIQTFGYALFFMNEQALQYLDRSDGWSIGAGPSVVVVDKGIAASLTSTTLTQDVYAIPFGQKGLMAGVGLEGSKITRINPN